MVFYDLVIFLPFFNSWFLNYELLLLSGVVHYQCFDGHGVPLVSVFKFSYHFCFFYFHPNTEALCIGNSCLPLQRFPSIFPLMLKFSISLFLKTCPKKLICLLRIVIIRFLLLLQWSIRGLLMLMLM